MGRRCSLTVRLPPKLYDEIESKAASGRYTIRELTQIVRGHGYVISHSAMGRFRKRLLSPAFALTQWALANPKRAAGLVIILNENPGAVFVALAEPTSDQHEH